MVFEQTHHTTLTTEAQRIIVANGRDLKTVPSENYSYESRITQEVAAGNFTALVREYGSIDTDEELLLVNVADRVYARLVHHRVSTPSCYWGRIEIQSLEEGPEGVVVKYTVNGEPFEGVYTLTAKTETKEATHPVLTKIS